MALQLLLGVAVCPPDARSPTDHPTDPQKVRLNPANREDAFDFSDFPEFLQSRCDLRTVKIGVLDDGLVAARVTAVFGRPLVSIDRGKDRLDGATVIWAHGSVV